MKQFYLKIVKQSRPDDRIFLLNGFKKAEEKAKELYRGQMEDGWASNDTYVCLCENYRDALFLDSDCYILKQDADGEITWFRRVFGFYGCLCERLTTAEEDAELCAWREEKEKHIWNLSKEELMKLHNEVTIGSIYAMDYENSFNINMLEVMEFCEGYQYYLEDFNKKDTVCHFIEYLNKDYEEI